MKEDALLLFVAGLACLSCCHLHFFNYVTFWATVSLVENWHLHASIFFWQSILVSCPWGPGLPWGAINFPNARVQISGCRHHPVQQHFQRLHFCRDKRSLESPLLPSSNGLSRHRTGNLLTQIPIWHRSGITSCNSTPPPPQLVVLLLLCWFKVNVLLLSWSQNTSFLLQFLFCPFGLWLIPVGFD